MLNYLQASPEAKARLLMQKEKRKRDSASECGIEKRQKIHLASMRAMLSQKNKSVMSRVIVTHPATTLNVHALSAWHGSNSTGSTL